MKISGKIIVITGSTSGIGKFLVDYFKENNTVVGLSRSAAEPDIACDISNNASVNSAVEAIKNRFGRVDILVNNAGYGLYGASELLTDEEIERQFSTNLTGLILLTKKMLPLMSKGAKVVNISSACALFPLPFRTMYCASKAGVSMFSHSLKMELSPYGIDVTAVCPGDIQSGFSRNRVKNYATNERYGDRISLADRKITDREHKRMKLSYAAGKIAKIIEKKRLKPMYIVGNKYKFLYFLYRVVPLSWFISVTKKLFS